MLIARLLVPYLFCASKKAGKVKADLLVGEDTRSGNAREDAILAQTGVDRADVRMMDLGVFWKWLGGRCGCNSLNNRR